MNSVSEKDGLCARQRTTITGKRIKKLVRATRKQINRSIFLLSISAAIALMLSSCDEKTNGQTSQSTEKDSNKVVSDSLNKPKVNIQVNRHYDDKGNMIGFDSTYSSFYSNVSGDTVQMDSLMHSFNRYFNQNHSSFFDRRFDPLFFSDSLRYPDFFHNDFFMKRYELNDQYLRESMRKMDSIKNKYFFEHSRERKSKGL